MIEALLIVAVVGLLVALPFARHRTRERRQVQTGDIILYGGALVFAVYALTRLP